VWRPFGAVPLAVICAFDECKAGSDEEEREVRAEGCDGVSTFIAYLSSWGEYRIRSQGKHPLKYTVRRLRPH
jgi:hypothetical protein